MHIHRHTVRRALLATVLTVSALAGLEAPAEAVPACDIAQFPSVQAAQSGLRFSCLFANGGTAATNEVSSSFTFHDFQNAEYHQGAARTVKVTTAAVAGSGAITASGGHFVAGDINHPVSGPGVPPRAFIKAVTPTTMTLNIPHLAIPINTVLTVENSDARTVDNIVTVSGSTTVTSATANFKTSDIGKSILASTLANGSTITAVATPGGGTSATVSIGALASTGTGYPVGCNPNPPLPTCNPPVATIGHTQAQSTTRSVTGATNTTTTITSANAVWRTGDIGLKVSGVGIPATAYIASFAGNVATIAGGAMTASATPKTIVIGEPGATAPANGSAVVQMISAFDLNPAQAGGSNNCLGGVPESFVQQGTWRNPGSYLTAGVLGSQPTVGQSIAQIAFESSVLTVGAYIQLMPAAVVGDPQAAAHYDLVFPFLAASYAMCPPPNAVKMALSVQVLPASNSQGLLAAGIGRPYSVHVRSLAAGSVGIKSATLKSNTATAPKNWTIPKSCTIPAANAVLAFSCGYP